MMCTHPTSRRTEQVYPFMGSVVAIGQPQNPAAHGNVCVLIECGVCGAVRRENRNHGHRERSAWTMPEGS